MVISKLGWWYNVGNKNTNNIEISSIRYGVKKFTKYQIYYDDNTKKSLDEAQFKVIENFFIKIDNWLAPKFINPNHIINISKSKSGGVVQLTGNKTFKMTQEAYEKVRHKFAHFVLEE